MTSNPYTAYRLEIENAVFDSPGKHLRVRIIILSVTLALVTLLTTLRFVLMLEENRRKGERLWFMRIVERGPGQTFVVTHQKPVGMCSAFVTSIILLAYTLKLYGYYLDQQNLSQAGGWRNFAFVPLVVHGWLSGWSALQSHLVVMESKGKKWTLPVAPIANWSYLASTIFFFAPLIVVAAYTTAKWQAVWTEYIAVHDLLETLEAAWVPSDGAQPPPQQYRSFRRTTREYLQYSIATKALYAVIAGITALINLFAFNLYFTLRKQIAFNLSDLQTPANSEDRRPSTAEVRVMAHHGIERAIRVQALQYASSTVFQTSVAMVLGSLAFAVYYAWAITVPTVTIELQTAPTWGAVECSAFLIVWIYAAFYLPLSLKLIWDTWVNLPRRNAGREPPPEDTVYAAFETRSKPTKIQILDRTYVAVKGSTGKVTCWPVAQSDGVVYFEAGTRNRKTAAGEDDSGQSKTKKVTRPKPTDNFWSAIENDPDGVSKLMWVAGPMEAYNS
ncbi:hypothetical protein OIO90_004993 [Microbotryomycetes sp. JL221]|nr:hypothetical protein OIO90_004993 [Microbotryomycetes sp. JL221]